MEDSFLAVLSCLERALTNMRISAFFLFNYIPWNWFLGVRRIAYLLIVSRLQLYIRGFAAYCREILPLDVSPVI